MKIKTDHSTRQHIWPPVDLDEPSLKAAHAPFSMRRAALQTLFSISAAVARNLRLSPREATVTLLGAGDFFGEESMSAEDSLHTSTASATTACEAVKIALSEMRRVLHKEPTFSEFFMKFIVMRGIRTQADLVDQLFNSSERRLARTLLLMADYGTPGEPVALIPIVTQETLAEMIGTTRSRVSFFMNRFRKLGYIEYNGRIHVHRSLLNVVLHDELPEENASRPKLLDPAPTFARAAKRAKLV